MFVILVYDISNSPEKEKKNYYKICKTIEQYLHRVQFSVFEGEIQPAELLGLKKILSRSVNKKHDSIVLYEFKSRLFTQRTEVGKKSISNLFTGAEID